MTYNLDKQNGVGFHFGQLSTKINEDNIEKGVNSFIGVNYGYAFDCINYDSFWIITLLGPYSAVFTTDDGSTYTYSGWGLMVRGVVTAGIMKMIWVLFWVLVHSIWELEQRKWEFKKWQGLWKRCRGSCKEA